MTETTDPIIVGEALEIIDRGLGDLQQREIISATEVANLLLDLRVLLAGQTDAEPVPTG
ncbi:MAG: hypothetical protein OEU32_15815 [Acidimicrobiia bacterium]|nr:hypothetical protein [Acidimicrobiia bacterium]